MTSHRVRRTLGAGTGGTGMPQRFVYGYDAAGNRAYAQITQGTNTARSYLYLYDALKP